VLLAEVLSALRPRPGGRYADLTLGGAGHAEAILRASGPDGWLFGCDCDRDAVEAARARLGGFAGRCELRHGNFAHATDWVARASCDGALMDLGISSIQLDDPARGLSFQSEGPLDARLDREQTLTAADLVNGADEADLARMLWELGGEPGARRVARAIAADRRHAPFRTTRQLAELVARVLPRGGRASHPATRTFLALRRAVNDEAGVLERGLRAVWQLLKPGGRLALITFHSAEDRQVKEFGRALALAYSVAGPVDVPELRIPRPPQLRWVNRKAIRPGAAELAANPRARSAQLRVMERL
jgi:16S rRNA (cytosine1402-N4)-methyltransferase